VAGTPKILWSETTAREVSSRHFVVIRRLNFLQQYAKDRLFREKLESAFHGPNSLFPFSQVFVKRAPICIKGACVENQYNSEVEDTNGVLDSARPRKQIG
jgi:hypothetical protein